MPKLPVQPKNPERICWGCDKYCSADALRCGNGTIRTPHPIELFGEDWLEWSLDNQAASSTSSISALKLEHEISEVIDASPEADKPASGI